MCYAIKVISFYVFFVDKAVYNHYNKINDINFDTRIHHLDSFEMPHYTCITIYNMFLGISYFLLFSVSWINTESTPVFTEFNRNQLLLEFPLNCIGGFLSSEVKCVMTAFEENKGIAIFNNKSLACQTCNEVIDGSYVPQVGDVAWSE